jgi:hypothetical protein
MLAADDIGDIYMNITADITAFITVQVYTNTTKLIIYIGGARRRSG